MRRTVILKLKEASDFGNIDANVNPRTFVRECIRVQQTILKDLICEPLYDYVLELVDLENDGTPLNGVYETLINDYIKPYLITEIEMAFIITDSNKITEKGTGKINDEFFRANEISQSKILIDRVNKYNTSYRNSLIDFLNDNKDTYPLYKECNCSEMAESKSSYSNSFSIL